MRTRQSDRKPLTEAERLVRELGSWNAHTRHAARKRLVEVGPSADSAVRAYLNRTIEMPGAGKPWFAWGVLALIVSSYATHSSVLNALFIVACAYTMIPTLLTLASSPVRRNLLRLLVESGDVKWIGAALGAADHPDPRDRRLAKAGLSKLVPLLSPADIARLTASDRYGLRRLLAWYPMKIGVTADPELAVNVIHVLEQMTDDESLGTLTWLARGEGVASGNEEVHVAAVNALAARQAMGPRPDSEILLRPAEDDSLNLVRAAGLGVAERDDQLLRAVRNGDGLE